MLGQRMNSCFILIYQSSLSSTLLPTFLYLFPAPHKALHFWRVNFSKQESVGGQRRHCLGPWEVWVCLWGCNLLFFLFFISESWRIFNRVPMQTASCRWRVIWSLSVHSWFDLRDLSLQEPWMSVAGEWEMLRLDASENFHWTLLGLPKQVKSPCPTEQSWLI